MLLGQKNTPSFPAGPLELVRLTPAQIGALRCSEGRLRWWYGGTMVGGRCKKGACKSQVAGTQQPTMSSPATPAKAAHGTEAHKWLQPEGTQSGRQPALQTRAAWAEVRSCRRKLVERILLGQASATGKPNTGEARSGDQR